MNPTTAPRRVETHLGGSNPEMPDFEYSGSRASGADTPRRMCPARNTDSSPLTPRNGKFQNAAIRSILIAGPAGRLEALLNEGAPDAPFAVLLCHPHPRYGGTMHNKVVYHAMKAMNDPAWGLGLPVLRFNFRGTGLSQGAYDGEAEVGDVRAGMDWLRCRFGLPLVVAGFSFGAAMALRACAEPDPAHQDTRALVALGLPIQTESGVCLHFPLQNLSIPKLFLSGDCDTFASAAQLTRLVTSAAEPKRLLLLPGADHFFTGQLEPMQRAVASWLKELRP